MTMTDNHPITPPPELVQEWYQEADDQPAPYYVYMAHQAARWGWNQCMKLDHAWLEAKMQEARDEELEACCEWLVANDWKAVHKHLCAARRPKPLSLKEQAIAVLDDVQSIDAAHYNILRNALEALPE